MKKISIGEYRRLNVEKLENALPLIITVEGEPKYVVGHIDSVIILSDLHPMVQKQLLARYNRVRFAMGEPSTIVADDIPEYTEE